MFKNNGNNRSESGDPASPERLNRIVEGSSVDGDLVCESNLRIDGRVKGTVRTNSRLVIGENGVVEGEVICKDGEIEGKVEGSLQASELISLRSTARIEGDIEVEKLAIEEGATFTGNCTMGGKGTREESRAQSHVGKETSKGQGEEEQE
ncbi:MAG: polymer-forming cytoskeletal protein [Flavobacteriales bacterium]